MTEPGRSLSPWTCPKCGPGLVVTAEQAATHERLCDGLEVGRVSSLVECIECGKPQTHRVCAECFEKGRGPSSGGEPVYGALARAEALAAGDEAWMNCTRWPRASGRGPSSEPCLNCGSAECLHAECMADDFDIVTLPDGRISINGQGHLPPASGRTPSPVYWIGTYLVPRWVFVLHRRVKYGWRKQEPCACPTAPARTTSSADCHICVNDLGHCCQHDGDCAEVHPL